MNTNQRSKSIRRAAGIILVILLIMSFLFVMIVFNAMIDKRQDKNDELAEYIEAIDYLSYDEYMENKINEDKNFEARSRELKNSISNLELELQQAKEELKVYIDIADHDSLVMNDIANEFNLDLNYIQTIVNTIDKQVAKYGWMNRELILSMIYQESAFDRYALGADQDSGLMQILPSTGAWIADELDMEYYSLMSIEDNIAMGCWLMDWNHNLVINKRMSDDPELNMMISLSMYNCGPDALNFYYEFNNQFINTYQDDVWRWYIEYNKLGDE